MSNLFRRELRGQTLILWNTNAETRNALSPDYYKGVLDGLKEAAESPDIAAVILTGEGGFFCSGGDLNLLKQRREMSMSERLESINGLHDIIREIRNCPKPFIAAVEGGAAGAGVSIALACDMLVSASGAKFVLAYVRAGLVPDGGATQTLMKILPRATVARMALLAHPIWAERLYELGAITEIVAPGGALNCACDLAEEVANGPQEAISAIKKLMNAGETASLEGHLETERTAMADALGRDEAQIGINAFLTKQTPVFRREGTR